MTYAKGPWRAEFLRVAMGIFTPDGEMVATVGPGRESKKADARLIAAAPELVDALKACCELIESENIEPPGNARALLNRVQGVAP